MKKIIPVSIAAFFLILSSIVYATTEKPTPPSPMPEALASPSLPVITLSTKGQVYDCGNRSVGAINIMEDNVHIANCTIVSGNDSSTDYSLKVRADGFTATNLKIYNNRTEGSLFDFVLPDGSCVSNTTLSNIYADGDVGWGFTGRICGLDLSDSQFYRIGKKSNSGKHFFYLYHSTDVTLRNIYVEDVWNSCLKIVGNVSFIHIDGMTCKNIGTSKSYGSGIMVGEGGDKGRQTDAHHLVFNNFQVINAFDGAVSVDDDRIYEGGRRAAYEVEINGVYYPVLYSMKTLPPMQTGTGTTTQTSTAIPATQTATPTATRTATHTPIPSFSPTPVPTKCEESPSYRICTKP